MAALVEHVREAVFALVVDKVICEDGIYRTFVALPELGDVPSATKYDYKVQVNAVRHVNQTGYSARSGALGAVAYLKKSEQSGTVSGVTWYNPVHPELPTIPPLPDLLPDDDETTAFKVKVREYAQKVNKRGEVKRGRINSILTSLGIEPLVGPKNWVFRLPLASTPNIVVEYDVSGVTTETDARAEMAKLVAADEAAGQIPASRLRVSPALLGINPADRATVASSTDA